MKVLELSFFFPDRVLSPTASRAYARSVHE